MSIHSLPPLALPGAAPGSQCPTPCALWHRVVENIKAWVRQLFCLKQVQDEIKREEKIERLRGHVQQLRTELGREREEFRTTKLQLDGEKETLEQRSKKLHGNTKILLSQLVENEDILREEKERLVHRLADKSREADYLRAMNQNQLKKQEALVKKCDAYQKVNKQFAQHNEQLTQELGKQQAINETLAQQCAALGDAALNKEGIF